MTPWDPELLARIHHLHLVAKRVVDSLQHGAHRSLQLGSAVEFSDYQEYCPGDPLKNLDWKVLGRTDRLVIRRFEAETELACYLVVDVSGDLGPGSSGRSDRPALDGSKYGHSLCLAASLAAFLIRRGEPVGLHVLGGDKEIRMAPRTGRSHLARMMAALADVRPEGRADLGRCLGQLGPRMRRRSLVAIVSDFMEEPGEWTEELAAFGRRGTDLVGFHVMDRQEMSLDFQEPSLLYSPEGGADISLDPVGAQGEFLAIAAAWREEVRGAFVRQGGRAYEAWSDRPLHEVLRRMIEGRP